MASESGNDREIPKTSVATPNPATAQQHRPTRVAALAAECSECRRHDHRAERVGRVQPSEATRPDAEDVLGVDGEQRCRTAEQHGEQVERDRREDERGVGDETNAGCEGGRG